MSSDLREGGSGDQRGLKLWQLWLLGTCLWGASIGGEALRGAFGGTAVDFRWSVLTMGYISTAVALVLICALIGRVMHRREIVVQVLAIIVVFAFRRIWQGLLLWAVGL